MRLLTAFTILFACALFSTGAFGQAVTGSITGSVKDQSGAAVTSASVVLANSNTGFTRTVRANEQGSFTAPSLPPGEYRVSAEMTGFKKSTVSGVQVNVDQKSHVDLVLQVGAVTDSVEVVATVPLVQADSSDLGTTVNETQIRELPLNGRNFVQLTRLIPGVVRGIPGTNVDGSGSSSWRATSSFSANGMRTRDNNYLLDGIDNNETTLASIVIFPSIDALQEFKVQTSTYSAEFGRSMGGVVNLHIKSGTNALHGSVFEFLRNDKFDANDLFNNKFGIAKPPFRQNQFGITMGGPIRRDRTFYFADYQGWRIRESRTYSSTVPMSLMRVGDFSEINRPIYDPLSQTPFTGNRIPATRLDPAAKAMMDQLFPVPNVAGQRGATGQVINNYLSNPVTTRDDDQFDVKIDHRFSPNNNFFGRYSFERSERFLPAALEHGDAGQTFGAGYGLIRAQSLALNDVHTFSPNWLNEFRFGFSRYGLLSLPVDYGTDVATQVGIPGINISDFTSGMSQITFTPGDIVGLGPQGNPSFSHFTVFQWNDNITYSRSRHVMKMGFNLIRRRHNQLPLGNPSGTINFRPQITSNCGGIASGCAINANTGFSVATLLLGYPTSLTRDLASGIHGVRRPEYGAYFQDDIRVSSRLTLNVGLRWDLFVPWLEHYDRQSNFDVGSAKYLLAAENATYSDGRNYGRRLVKTSYRDFAPRFGFAYDLTGGGKTVVRGGYGIFWNPPFAGSYMNISRNQPFVVSQSLTTTLLPTFRLRDGFPAPPAFDSSLPPSGVASAIVDPDFTDAYGQSWNLNIQRQLGNDYLLEVAYVGTKGTDLMMRQDINQAPAIVGVTNIDVNRPFIRRAPLMRAMQQAQSRSLSNHHSLQAKFTKRFAQNFMFLNTYTFGRTIDLVSEPPNSTLNGYNFNMDRGVAQFDIKHTFNSSWTYELPFGKGRIGSGAGPVAQKLIGGWNLNGIVLLRSGLPFTVTQQQGLLSTGTGNRPDRIARGELSNPTPDRWFDLTAFRPTTDNTGTFGSSGRNILRAPGQMQFDLSVVKHTRFKERFQHELRIECFNAFNHPQFASPGAGIGTAAAGVISSLLFSTPMRQLQFAMKLSF